MTGPSDELLARADHHARLSCELLLDGEITAAKRHARERRDLVRRARKMTDEPKTEEIR